MTDTDAMADNAVRGNSNGTSNGMADNAVTNSNSDVRVGSSAVVGDLGNVAIGVVGVVCDMLDPAVGEVDRVGAVPEAGSIVSLSLLEGSSRELVSDAILVGVGGDLSQIIVANSMGDRMSHCMHHRPGHGLHHRSSYGHRSSNCHTMANNTMSSHHTMSSHKTMSSHETTSSQQLGGGRGSSGQGRDAKEGLWDESGFKSK